MRNRLIFDTDGGVDDAQALLLLIVNGLLLVVGSRMLAGLLGGHWGDRMGYERARRDLREAWAELVVERDGQPAEVRR